MYNNELLTGYETGYVDSCIVCRLDKIKVKLYFWQTFVDELRSFTA